MIRVLVVLLSVLPLVAQETMVLRGPPLPVGAIQRFGMPSQADAGPYVGGYTSSGSYRLVQAHAERLTVWAWEPLGRRPPVHRLVGHQAPIERLALSGDARCLLTADRAGEVRWWELATGESIVLQQSGNVPTAMLLDARGQRAWLADNSTLWRFDIAERTRHRVGQHRTTITHIASSSKMLAFADAAGSILLWNPADDRLRELPWQAIPNKPTEMPDVILRIGKPAPEEPQKPLQHVHDFDRGITKLLFSSDGQHLAAAGGTVVRVWHWPSQKLRWEHNRHARVDWGFSFAIMNYMPPPQPPRQVGAVHDIAFSRDGQLLVSSGYHDDVLVQETRTGKVLERPEATPVKRSELL